MREVETKPKYEKPIARTLGDVSGAEGACNTNGLTASGTTCTNGVSTFYCEPGGTGTPKPPPFCTPGGDAANCVSNGGDAGG